MTTANANSRSVALTQAAGAVLGMPPRAFADATFAELGGTSLRAVDLSARAESLGYAVAPARLLGREKLAEVLAHAEPMPPAAAVQDDPAHSAVTGSRAATSLELHMLLGEETDAPSAYRLLFSADVRGELDRGRLEQAIQAVVDRHDALRTVFEYADDGLRARVLPRVRARITFAAMPDPDADSAVEALHRILERDPLGMPSPFAAPPLVFTVVRVAERRHLIGMQVHHVLADGWSIGLIWRDVFAQYASPGSFDRAPAWSPRPVPEEAEVQARITRLAEIPTVLEPVCDDSRPERFDQMGARLPIALDEPTRAACEALARSCGVTRNTVVFAAWGLVLMRRTGSNRFLLGLSWAGRSTARERDAVGLATTLLPVDYDARAVRTVRELLESTADRMRDALGAADVPFSRLANGLHAQRDPRRPTLVQAGFAAHDELVPEALSVPGLDVRVHEGHAGGAVLEALLYVQRWTPTARLCLEYASGVYGPEDAAELAADLQRVLRAMTLDTTGGAELASLPAGCGPLAGPEPARTSAGLWQLFEEVAWRCPEAHAVDEPGNRRLTYRELLAAAEDQAAALHAAGVRAGDRVVLAMPRGAGEIITILAVIRCGAAYVGLEPGLPPAVAERMLRIAKPLLAVADPERTAEFADLGVPTVAAPVDPRHGDEGRGGPPPAAEPDPERVAYVAFTSGTSGTPKAVRIAHRGVLRLVDGSDIVTADAARRFLRFAPLSFDASTLEIFTPLARGGTIVVLPDRQPTPAAIAAFLERNSVTGLWLTAGLFRLVADHRPDAFRPVRQLLTGGDTVPPGQVRTVLEHCPGLRVTNGYGPTENTTFTTVHHLDDAAEVGEVLPIGRPVAGTSVLVADADGRPVVRGAVGELLTGGLGLAVDYAGDPAETARSFVFGLDGVRYYRTGDLARWDRRGDLRILGRRDRQVKIRGFRIELDAVGRALRELPGVRDAVAVTTAEDAADRRIVAGLVVEPGVTLESVRAAVGTRLADYAVPSLWALVPELPVTAQGKVDAAALAAIALGVPETREQEPADREQRSPLAENGPAGNGPAANALAGNALADVEDGIARIWEELLDTDDFGYDDRFFEVGGTSLLIPTVRERLRAMFPDREIKLVDLFAYTTVAELAAFVFSQGTVSA